MLGLPTERFGIDWSHLVMNMITIKGIYAGDVRDVVWMSVLVHSASTSPGDHAQYAATDYEEGFEAMRNVVAARSCSPGPKPDRRSAMFTHVRDEISAQLEEILSMGFSRRARHRHAAAGHRKGSDGKEVLNLCANNYSPCR